MTQPPRPEELPFALDRARTFQLDGRVTYAQAREEELSLEERERVRVRLWNEFVLPEIESTYRMLDSTYDEPVHDPAEKFERWLRRDDKYRDRVVTEWRKRFATYRYIDGFVYALRWGPGLILLDCFSFDRWRPEAFPFQVQHWIEGDTEIVEHLKKSLNIAWAVAIGLGVVAIVALVMLFGPQ